MADLHEYTTKEVLNKVLLDSSGNAVAAYSHTTQEALNAVLDSANSRLNVSLVGGTISGDLTITGDFKVEGGGSFSYDEIIEGTLSIQSNSADSAIFVIKASDGIELLRVDEDSSGNSSLKMRDTAGNVDILFRTGGLSYINNGQNFGIGTSSPNGKVAIHSASAGGSSAIYNRADELVIENSDHAGITIKSPNDKETSVFFGDADDSSRGGIRYNHDGDTMTFQVASAKLILDANSRISLSNNDNGTSNTLFGNNCGNLIGSGGNHNVFIGELSASQSAMTGSSNVGIGKESLKVLETGGHNNAVGYQALDSLTTGAENQAMGAGALAGLTTQNSNIAIGGYAGTGITGSDAINNVIIGGYAGTGGSGNLKRSIAIGNNALNSTAGNAILGAVAIGYDALTALTSGSSNIAIGYQSGKALTVESSNTAIGYGAMSAVAKGSGGSQYTNHNIAIGVNAMTGGIPASGSFEHNIAIGNEALNSTGTSAGSSGTIAIGSSALTSLTDGQKNTAIGFEALKLEDDGDFNTAVGYQALANQEGRTGTVNNTAVGHRAGASMTSGFEATLVGSNAGAAITTGFSNTAIGANAMDNMTTGDYNTAVGPGALSQEDVGRGTTAIGYQALYSQNSDSNDENTGNSALGYHSGYAMTTGTNNTSIGYEALTEHTTGSNNVALGFGALYRTGGSNASTSTDNIAIGTYALGGDWANVVSNENVAIGRSSLQANLNGSNYNVAVGHNALFSQTEPDGNVAVGYQSGYYNVTGGTNTWLGYVAGKGASGESNSGNTGLGYASLMDVTTGGNNTAVGKESLVNLTTGDNNVAVGSKAGEELATGTNNTIVGYNAGKNLDSGESGNTIIGSGAMEEINNDSQSNCVAIGLNALKGNIGGSDGDNSGVPVSVVAIGNEAMAHTNVRGCTGNIAVGTNAMDSTFGGTVTDCIAIGRDSMHHASNQLNAPTGSIGIGKDSLKALTSGDYNFGGGVESIKAVTTGTRNVALGLESGSVLTTGSYNTMIGSNTNVGANNHSYTTSLGYQAESENDFETTLGYGGAFRFASFTYEADHASADDGDIASSHGSNLKIPAYAVIKSVSAIVTRLSNLSTYNLAVVMSDDAASPSDDAGMTNAVELIGAGASTSKSGGSGNASDIECASSGGHTVKASFYNGFDGNGQHVGTGDKYIHLVNAGTSNGDTDPSTTAQVKILVEYVGMD